jgi:S-adenosylmethionine:tRNA ribosyltransferase-isomerase
VKTKDFSFELPPELIAQRPADRRDDARLLVLNRSDGSRRHSRVSELPEHLREDSLLVFNDTRVRKARLHAERVDTGGNVEFLLTEQAHDGTWWAITDGGKRARVGIRFRFPEGRIAEVAEQRGSSRLLRFDVSPDEAYLERVGLVPLPPYIKRPSDEQDASRYQTVYARHVGSVAAPTAGLHFTDELLDELGRRGIETRFLTLHVGLGTFAPVRAKEVERHEMHSERFEISEETASAVNEARNAGRPVVAVGTTSVRALETAASDKDGRVDPGVRETDIFIYPGYRFRVVDQLFTNFHTPESTLVMLVAAFAGTELILDTYREAVERRYRFFSYGDAMLIQ